MRKSNGVRQGLILARQECAGKEKPAQQTQTGFENYSKFYNFNVFAVDASVFVAAAAPGCCYYPALRPDVD